MQSLPNTGMPLAYQPTAPLPLISLDLDDAAEFDYSAFLEQDMGYLAEDSSPSSATLSDGTLPRLTPRPQQVPPSTALTVHGHASAAGHDSSTSPGAARQLKQRLGRRGHFKSRLGCLSCKKRRIKCQETRPSCGHCVKQGLQCHYPSAPSVVHQPQHQIPLFSLQDMRFFQHFLFEVFPRHPIGSEDLWTHDIPCLSHKYEYLMHAILGYSASTLLCTDRSLAATAMDHRLKAIRSIKRVLADVPQTDFYEQGNALMATCFALTYQSVLLDDGMVEYMTFIRGLVIVAIQMYIKGSKLMFGELLGEKQTEKLAPFMKALPLIEKDWTDRAVAGIRGLEGLVIQEGREVERRYWELILKMGEELKVSSWQAYLALTEHYTFWMMMPHDKFQTVIDPANQVAVLLSTHWIALEAIMATITETEHAAATRPNKSETKGNAAWLRYLNSQVDVEHRVYNDFPVWVEAQLNRDLAFFGKTV